MTEIELSEPMLYVLRAMSRGEVTQRPDWDAAPWRLASQPEYGHLGRVVTRSVQALFRRGLGRPAVEVNDHNRRPALVTADGHEQISKGAHRRA